MAEDLSQDQIRTKWPAYTWALNIPDLAAVLKDPRYTDANQLAVALQGTPWWKETAPAVKNYYVQSQMDPSGQTQDRAQKEADIYDKYLSLGLKPDTAHIQGLAASALRFGWTSAQLNDAIVAHLQFSPDILDQLGGIQTTANQFKEQASQYFVSLDDGTAFNWAKSVASGEKKAEDYLPIMQQWAQSKFSYSPEIQNAVKSGVTVKQYFAPFQQEASKLLEVPPESIDFAGSPKWSKVLDTTDDKGARRPMTLSEMQTYVRGMDEWKKTRQAQSSAASLGLSILKKFGKVAS